jgi:hypothetical protein
LTYRLAITKKFCVDVMLIPSSAEKIIKSHRHVGIFVEAQFISQFEILYRNEKIVLPGS